MPDSDFPDMSRWVPYLAKEIGAPDPDTYLVGHSMGSQAILRYLAGLKDGETVGGVLFVAGFVNINWKALDSEGKKIFRPLMDEKPDLASARKHSKKFVSIFSSSDPYVPTSDCIIFRDQLGSAITMMPNAGHFTINNGGYRELHIALNEILKMP